MHVPKCLRDDFRGRGARLPFPFCPDWQVGLHLHEVCFQPANQVLLLLNHLEGITVLSLEGGEVVWGRRKEEGKFEYVRSIMLVWVWVWDT